MKRKHKILIILLAVAVTAVVYFVPKKNGGFGFEQTKTYFEVRGFLKDIIAEDLDSAVENIWFFDNEENLENGTELSVPFFQNYGMWLNVRFTRSEILTVPTPKIEVWSVSCIGSVQRSSMLPIP